MRPKTIALITVMILTTSFFYSLIKPFSRHSAEISQTGQFAVASPVSTILSQPIRVNFREPAAKKIQPSLNVSEIAYTPALERFVSSVINGDAERIVGVYVANTMALPIIQQPDNNPNFVSTKPETITQFDAASRFQTIGLLAHNYLAGTHFSDLQPQQLVTVVFGDGRLSYYQVEEVQRYQALSPNSPQSDFVDLNNDGNEQITAADVFQRVYTLGDRVVFQTCIFNDGDPSWGRLFIIATPLETAPTSMMFPLRPRILALF